MSSRVVCISRVNAAGGEIVGELAAEVLGFRFVNDEIIRHAAEQAGLDPSVVATAERHRSLFTRMMEMLVSPPQDVKGGLLEPAPSKAPQLTSPPPTSDELRRLIKEAIVAIADRGDAVIVAHGASFALRDRTDTLRVHVTASMKTRLHRAWVPNRLVLEEDHAEALLESDRQRARYLANFYGIAQETPELYDLVVNTDAVDYARAAAAVVALVRA